LDFACYSAQRAIGKLQGRGGIYFAGGWASHAGLHEHCVTMAREVVSKMFDSAYESPYVDGVALGRRRERGLRGWRR
jgi:hypothetical protein